MTVDEKIKREKLQFGVNREAAKIPGLSSIKFDKYKYLTGEQILLSDQSRIIEKPLRNKSRLRIKNIKLIEKYRKHLTKSNTFG